MSGVTCKPTGLQNGWLLELPGYTLPEANIFAPKNGMVSKYRNLLFSRGSQFLGDMFDLDTRPEAWNSKEANLVLSMKSTTGPFEEAPSLNLLGGCYSSQAEIPRPALAEAVRQFRAAVIEGRMDTQLVPYKLLTATDTFAKLEFCNTLKLLRRGPRLRARASTIGNNILRVTMSEMLQVPLTSLFVASRGPHGESNVDLSAELIFPHVVLKPSIQELDGEEVLGLRTPAALQVYGEDIFKPTDLLLRRLAEMLFENKEVPGLQLRCNQGDSLYVHHIEKTIIATIHLEEAKNGGEERVAMQSILLSSSSHNDASSSDMQVGSVIAHVEDAAFRLANGVAETDLMHKLITALKYDPGDVAALADNEHHQRVSNMIRFHADITRRGPVFFQNLKAFSCSSGQYLKSGVLNHNDCTSRAVMSLSRLVEEKVTQDLSAYSPIALPAMFGTMSKAYLGDSLQAPLLTGVTFALRKHVDASGENGEVTNADNVKRLMLPQALEAYLTSLGGKWHETFLQELADIPEVVKGHVRRVVILEDTLLNPNVNLEEQAVHWLNWTAPMPIYPGTNQLNMQHLEGVDQPRQFFGFEQRALYAVDLGLPRNFDCQGIFINTEGQVSLRRGPAGMPPHVLKTNVISMEKLVGLLTSTKSYSMSRRTRETDKVTKRAGYLEATRIIAPGAQGVPYERIRFAPSESVARAQLVLAMGGQLTPALKRGATFVLENALASDEVDTVQVARAVELMAMDVLGVALEQSTIGAADQTRSSCSTRELLNDYHIAHLLSKAANCSLPAPWIGLEDCH